MASWEKLKPDRSKCRRNPLYQYCTSSSSFCVDFFLSIHFISYEFECVRIYLRSCVFVRARMWIFNRNLWCMWDPLRSETTTKKKIHSQQSRVSMRNKFPWPNEAAKTTTTTTTNRHEAMTKDLLVESTLFCLHITSTATQQSSARNAEVVE